MTYQKFEDDYEQILAKKTVNGAKITKRILERNPDNGAVAVEITGLQGSGKTSLELWFADTILKKYPEEMVLWRDSLNSPLQFTKIGYGKYKILIEAGSQLKFAYAETLQPANVPFTTFTDMEDLYSKCKKGKINAVYFKDEYSWIDFIKYLRIQPGWQSVFLDEYEDVCPQRCRGEQWHRNEWFGNNIKLVRKQLVSVFGNTQSNMDVDVRVRNKMMIWIYLFGARVDNMSPIFQKTVSSLKIGEAWLDWGHSIYGEVKFPAYYPQKPIITAIDHTK